MVLNLENGDREVVPVPSLEGVAVSAASYDAVHQRVSVGLEDGRVGSFRVEYKTEFAEDGSRTVEPSIITEPWFDVESGEGAVKLLSYGDGDSKKTILVARRPLAPGRMGNGRNLHHL